MNMLTSRPTAGFAGIPLEMGGRLTTSLSCAVVTHTYYILISVI